MGRLGQQLHVAAQGLAEAEAEVARWREAEVVRAAEVAAAEQQLAAAEVRASAL